jgi:hypothetical protein
VRSGVTPRLSRCSWPPGRLAELAGIRYDPHDPGRSDIDLWQREIVVRGKLGIVKLAYDVACGLDRYLRVLPGKGRRTGRSCGWGR